MTRPAPPPLPRLRPSWTSGAALAELLAITGIAVTQPVLDRFGRAPDLFVDLGAGRRDIVLFALIVAVVPAALLFALELVATLLIRRDRVAVAHVALLASLVALFAIQALKSWTGAPAAIVLVGAVAAAFAFSTSYRRWAAVRAWTRLTAIGPAIFVVLFLFTSPVHPLLSGSARAGTPVEARTDARGPIVLIVFDELPLRSLLAPDGTIDAERFPGFGALAADSTWYRSATSVATHTNYAVPAILTGEYADSDHVSPDAVLHPDNVFRLLGTSFRFNVVESKTRLCVVPRCDLDDPANAPDPQFATDAPARADDSGSPLARLLRRARTEYTSMVALGRDPASVDADQSATDKPELVTPSSATPGPSSSSPTTSAPSLIDPVDAVARPAQFDAWLQRIDADVEHPQLSVIHTVLPHSPWFLDGRGTQYQVPEGDANLVGFEGLRWLEAPGATTTARQRHLLQVRYTDTLVAALRDRLRRLEIWDDTTVIVTADHGAAFEPGGYFRRWEPENSADVAGVPLFVHGPDFVGDTIVDEPAQTVDIVPTVAAVAGATIPWPVDGADLRALPAVARTEHPYVKARDDLGGARVEMLDTSKHLEALLADVPTRHRNDGDDEDLAILRIGPSGELIGNAVDDLDVVTASTGTIHLDYPRLATDAFVANRDGEVPALLIGTVRDVPAATTIVITLDDRVAATADVFVDTDGDVRFTALLPPSWLAGGTHRVEFFQVMSRNPVELAHLRPG